VKERLDAGQAFDEFAPRIYRYIYHRLGQRAVAEDLTSEVFVRLVRMRERPDNLSAYLYRIAHNIVIDYVRRNPAGLAPLDETYASEGNDPARAAQLEAERIRLRRAINRLTPDQQQVIILKYVEGLGNLEVAEIMGRPEGAVKALQHRALDSLRRLLGGAPQADGRLEFAGLME
jgi:RNA polymerase sigma-70 factor (ECF subfamily)